jgi:predicted nuclease with TOPRIM domain
MNKSRRKALVALRERIEEIKGDLAAYQEEEQEYLDSMPEGLQNGATRDKATEAIDNLESALSSLDDAAFSIEEAEA